MSSLSQQKKQQTTVVVRLAVDSPLALARSHRRPPSAELAARYASLAAALGPALSVLPSSAVLCGLSAAQHSLQLLSLPTQTPESEPKSPASPAAIPKNAKKAKQTASPALHLVALLVSPTDTQAPNSPWKDLSAWLATAAALPALNARNVIFAVLDPSLVDPETVANLLAACTLPLPLVLTVRVENTPAATSPAAVAKLLECALAIPQEHSPFYQRAGRSNSRAATLLWSAHYLPPNIQRITTTRTVASRRNNSKVHQAPDKKQKAQQNIHAGKSRATKQLRRDRRRQLRVDRQRAVTASTEK